MHSQPTQFQPMQSQVMDPQTDWATLLAQLAEPFPKDAVYWRAGALTKDKKRAQALPYAEPRVYEDRLNKLCAGEWEVRFSPWGENRIICELTVHGVTRSSTGEFEDNKAAFAQGTVAEAQAFKRACSKFGLGRYLYDIPLSWVDYDQAKGKLLETPELPAKFLPERNEAKSVKPKKQSPEQPRLTPERAEAMTVELEKLGFARKEQLKLVTSILKHRVSALTQLNEAEALEVWASAKRLSQSVA